MNNQKAHQDRVPMSQFNPSWMAGDARNPYNVHLNLTQLEVSVQLNYATATAAVLPPFHFQIKTSRTTFL